MPFSIEQIKKQEGPLLVLEYSPPLYIDCTPLHVANPCGVAATPMWLWRSDTDGDPDLA